MHVKNGHDKWTVPRKNTLIPSAYNTENKE